MKLINDIDIETDVPPAVLYRAARDAVRAGRGVTKVNAKAWLLVDGVPWAVLRTNGTVCALGECYASLRRAEAAVQQLVTIEAADEEKRVAAIRARLEAAAERSLELVNADGADEPDLIHGYTRVELEYAFNLVADPTNWKNPIDKRLSQVSPAQRDKIKVAVTYFAGCVPSFSAVPGTTDVQVTAQGYYMAVGS